MNNEARSFKVHSRIVVSAISDEMCMSLHLENADQVLFAVSNIQRVNKAIVTMPMQYRSPIVRKAMLSKL